MYIYIYIGTYVRTYTCMHLSVSVAVFVPVSLSLPLSLPLSVCLSVGRSVSLSVCLSVCLSLSLSISLSWYDKPTIPELSKLDFGNCGTTVLRRGWVLQQKVPVEGCRDLVLLFAEDSVLSSLSLRSIPLNIYSYVCVYG